MDLVVRHADDLLILSALIFHLQHANRPGADDGAGHHLRRGKHQRVRRVAIIGQRAGNETVGGRIGHRREQEAVDEDGAAILVDLVFDRGALGDFDHDIDIVRRLLADGDLY